MATLSTSANSFTLASFANLFGIFVSLVLTTLFVVFGAHALKYLKAFACKIKIIINRAHNKQMALKDYNYKTIEGTTRRSPQFDKMECIFKNEVMRSRSLEYFNIVGSYMAKYNHLIYYPFRDKIFEKYDLLKPKSTFFNLLFISTVCVCWMITIFLSSLLQNRYSDISNVSVSMFVALTLAIAIISTLINLIIVNRLFRLYTITIKNAFKVDYGHKYRALNEIVNPDLAPKEESFEEIQKQEELLQAMQAIPQQFDEGSYQTLHRETQIDGQQANSTRKLLGEEIEPSDSPKTRGNDFNDINQISENKEGPKMSNNGSNKMLSLMKKKAIKDMFELQVKIYGIDKARENEKYIYLYDRHAIGDRDFLQNEALKAENKSNIVTLLIMFIVFSCSAIACCYLNYKFDKTLSRNVFFIFVGALILDMILFRMLAILLMALIRFLIYMCKGYKKLEYSRKQFVHNLLAQNLASVFSKKGDKEYQSLVRDSSEQESKKRIEDMDQESIIKEAIKNYMSNNHEDLNMSASKKYHSSKKSGAFEVQPCEPEEEDKEQFQRDEEDQEAHVIEDDEPNALQDQEERKSENGASDIEMNGNEHAKRDDHILNPFSEIENMDGAATKSKLHSFQNKLLKSMGMKVDNEIHDKLMESKQIVPDLTDYNLFLLRKIFDGFDDRADKVLDNFRSDKNKILRKRYMVPIVNPNYPFQKLLEDIQNRQQNYQMDQEEDEGFVEGELKQQQEDKQELEGITVEMKSKLKGDAEGEEEKLKVKEAINKYGKKVSDRKNEEHKIVMPLPAYGKKEYELEKESTDADIGDDWESRKKELERLRQKKRAGEELTEQEQKRFVQLEQEEDKHRSEDINNLQQKKKRTSQEGQKLQELLEEESEYRNRRIDDLYEKKQHEGLTEEEESELKRLMEWRQNKRKREMQELLEKQKKKKLTKQELQRIIELEEEDMSDLYRKLQNGEELTEEELRRLEELENTKLKRINQEIEELLKKGDNLSDEERLRLIQLQKEEALLELSQLKRKNPPLSEEDLKRIKELEEELERLEMKELQLKQKMGQITEEELERLRELETRYKMQELSVIEKEENHLNESGQEENPFKDNQEDEDQKQKDEQSEQSEMAYSRITDKDNFANLPPVEVLSNQNKPTSAISNKKREHEAVKEDEKKEELLQEDLQKLEEQQKQDEQQKFEAEQVNQGDQKILIEENHLQKQDEEKEKKEEEKQEEEQDKEKEGKQNESGVRAEGEKELSKSQISQKESVKQSEKVKSEQESEAKEEMLSKKSSQKLNQSNSKSVKDQELAQNSEKSLGQIDNENQPVDGQLENDKKETQEQEEKEKLERELEEKRQEDEKEAAKQQLKEQEEQQRREQELERVKEEEEKDQLEKEKIRQQEEDQQKLIQAQEEERQQKMKEEQEQLLAKEEEERQKQQELERAKLEEEEQQKKMEEDRVKQEELERNKLKEEEQKLKEEEEKLKEEERQREMMKKEEELKQKEEEEERLRELKEEERLNELKQREQELKAKEKEQEEIERAEQLAREEQEQKVKQEEKRRLEEEELKQRELEEYKRIHQEQQEKERQIEQEREQEKLKELQRQKEIAEQQELERAQAEEYATQQQEKQELLKKQLEEENLKEQMRLKQEEENALQKLQEQEAKDQNQQDLFEQEQVQAQNQINRSELDNSNAAVPISSSSQMKQSRKSSKKQSRKQSEKQKVEQQSPHQKNDEVQSRPDSKQKKQSQPLSREKIEAPPAEAEESIYSHKTSTILDEEKVSFMHIEHLPNQDGASDDSFSEQDMVYYNKDDLTNYSKGLGLNKVRAKNPNKPNNYFSENDIQEVQESDQNESVSSLERAGRERGRMGRGQIRHNQFDIQSHNDNVDGRVKVDSWNLNYRKKKRKLKQKKVDQKVRNRMGELQNIYGVDAKTLAGMQQGKIPKQSTPFKYDTNRDSENSFRSTQNTLMKRRESSAQGKYMNNAGRQSQDGISNMFSFHGGKSRRWNDIESTLRGKPFEFPESQQKSNGKFTGKKRMTETQQKFGMNAPSELQGISEDELHESKRNKSKNRPLYGSGSQGSEFGSNARSKKPKKNFLAQQKQFKSQRRNQNEEGKSEDSFEVMPNRNQARNGRQKTMKDSYMKQNQGKQKKGRGNQEKNHKNKTQGNVNRKQRESESPMKFERGRNNNFSAGQDQKYNANQDYNYKSGSQVESHEESEEAVDNQGTNFQTNDGYEQYQNLIRGQDQQNRKLSDSNQDELEHTESEEGIVQDRPNFDDNENLFKRREAQPEQQQINSNKGPQGRPNEIQTRMSRNGLSIEDLDAHSIPGDQLRIQNRASYQSLSQSDQNYIPNFYNYQREQNAQSRERSLGSDIEMHGVNRQNFQYDSPYRYQQHLNHGKPPKSKSKSKSKAKKAFQESEGEMPPNTIYAEPYNINGRIHPGVSDSFRPGQPKYISDLSDNEGGKRSHRKSSRHGTKIMTETDRDFVQSKKKRNTMMRDSNGHSYSPQPMQIREQDETQEYEYEQQQQQMLMRNRSIDDQIDHTSDGSKLQSQFQSQQHLHLNRIRSQPNNLPHSSRSKQKKNVRKAAASQSDRDFQFKKIQEKQNQRIKRMQQEAEGALLKKHGDDETATMRNLAKKKKKKQKKDWIRKEVNYWLDYDSPYAEYLVARFREWQPQVKPTPSNRGISHNQRHSEKFNELHNLYERESVHTGHNYMNNRNLSISSSPDRDGSFQYMRVSKRSSGIKPKVSNQQQPAFRLQQLELDQQEEVEDL